VVLVDDHAKVREGFAALCEVNGMKVLGQCSYGPSVVETILAKQPDIAILDLHLPGMTGIEVIRGLRSAGCTAKVVVLSISREDKHLIAALRAGADACLLKDGPARHLLEAISYVRDGGQYISPLLKGARLFTKANANAPGDPLATESPPETKVFSYLVMGKRAKDIAERLRFWRRRR
jgi:two-component system nitrate/nitrite response regulator NarL